MSKTYLRSGTVLLISFLLLITLNVHDALARSASTPTRTVTLIAKRTSTPLPTSTPPCPPTEGMRGSIPLTDAPVRASVGKGHILRGIVRSSVGCTPIADAKLVFWLAGPDGNYGPAYEAAVFTDERGRYRFESTFPGTYENTAPHIHMYVEATGYIAIETVFLPKAGTMRGVYNIVLEPQS